MIWKIYFLKFFSSFQTGVSGHAIAIHALQFLEQAIRGSFRSLKEQQKMKPSLTDFHLG